MQADGVVEGGQLRERGFYLFHDVPLTGVNIDHVVRSSCWQQELVDSRVLGLQNVALTVLGPFNVEILDPA